MYKNIYTSVTSDSVSEHLNEESHSDTDCFSVCVSLNVSNNLVFKFDAENYLKCFIFYVRILLSIILSLTGMCIDMYVQLYDISALSL